MIESFVDLGYRGLTLGRRVKLSQVRPSSGYLETPAPMPVGTAIVIATDEGHSIKAKVLAIHEQTGGSDKAPGMTVAPELAGEAIESWWRARVSYPDEPRPSTTELPVVSRTSSKPITVRPRAHAVPDDVPPISELVAAAAKDIQPAGGNTDVMPVIRDVPNDKATMIMPAIDQELLEQLTRPSGEIEQLVRTTGEHEVIDDGKQTMIMDAIDPAALGLLDSGNSGSFSAVDEDGNGNGNAQAGGDDKKPGKKKRKRR
ncbi:MAG: hypothetical protein H0T46_07760 [Deltaproteobacteria bacterium]|nr:hypothetical protein [Deltaproteobacteria bacterium]